MLNDLNTGFFRSRETWGDTPQALCHIASVAVVLAVLVGFCIYKLANFFEDVWRENYGG